MRPRNKRERAIVELSKSLPKGVTGKSYDYAIHHCFNDDAYLCKGLVSCCGCGEMFEDDGSGVCPHCGKHVNIIKSRKMSEQLKHYHCELVACDNYIVVRTFMGWRMWTRGQKTRYSFLEVCQRWIDNEGKATVIALPKGFSSYYCDTWQFGREMTIKYDVDNMAYRVHPYSCYVYSVTPILMRNGLYDDVHEVAPHYLVEQLLTSPRYETLWKAGQYGIIREISSRWVDSHWNTLKCVMRHKYDIADAGMWQDYIDACIKLGMDALNPVVVCPTNLQAEHDRVTAEVARREERERAERERRRAIEEAMSEEQKQNSFKKLKGMYFGIVFGNGSISVSVLDSIQAYADEGKAMHHCVFSNKYYGKDDSLILSAKDADGNRLATIELSLNDWCVLQCRGVNNSRPKDYDEICGLVRSNIPMFIRAKKRNYKLAS